MIKSKAINYKDYSSRWYKKWSIILKQTDGLYGRKIHNKAWQNAIILETLYRSGYLKSGKRAIGFGVGTERMPSALASLGLRVTATDQDVESGLKAGWDNLGQLTHDKQDLNQYGIAPTELFEKNVEFINADMNNIQSEFSGNYDIVWSNCALGHLGTLDSGLAFIENSLACLKPGGIAVHTTEINAISNTNTLDRGGTVIFRQGDMVNLFYRLRQQGYKCAPLYLNFGSEPEDMKFSGYPYDDEPLLKLNVGRHLLSQMVLVIVKPKKLSPQRLASFMNKVEIRINSHLMRSFYNRNRDLQIYVENNPAADGNDSITPQKRSVKLKLKPNEVGTVKVTCKNTSTKHYYDTHQVLQSGCPLVVATNEPVNRVSKLSTKAWASKTRPALQLSRASGRDLLTGIAPGEDFETVLEFKAPKQPGAYREAFCFVLEGASVIADSQFDVTVEVA